MVRVAYDTDNLKVIVKTEDGDTKVCLTCCPCEPGFGTGTELDPYRIRTFADLCQMMTIQTPTNRLDAYWELCNDIDASASAELDGGRGWTPVGTYVTEDDIYNFVGSFNGNGFTISGLTIDRYDQPDDMAYVGFFGSVLLLQDHSITNLTLKDVSIRGTQSVGGFAGLIRVYDAGTITNCHTTGFVYGGMAVGGFAGRIDIVQSVDIISKCSSACMAQGEATQSRYIGGFVGSYGNYYNWQMPAITDCYATGEVYGWTFVGGFVGENRGCFANCYSKGYVHGSYFLGGLVGGTFTISHPVIHCFWDRQTSTQESSIGGRGLTTAEMKSRATYSVYKIGFDGGTTEPIVNETLYVIGSPTETCIVEACTVISGGWNGTAVGYIWVYPISAAFAANFAVGDDLENDDDELICNTTSEDSWDFDTIWDMVENISYPFFRECVAWEEGHNYVMDEQAESSIQNCCECIKPHTSTTDDAPITGANWETYWELIMEWVLGRAYSVNERVPGTDGLCYRCKVAHIATTQNRPVSGTLVYWMAKWEIV